MAVWYQLRCQFTSEINQRAPPRQRILPALSGKACSDALHGQVDEKLLEPSFVKQALKMFVSSSDERLQAALDAPQ